MKRRTNSAAQDCWWQAASLCRAGGGVWVPSAVAGILLFKGLDRAQGNRERGAVVSCVLYAGHQWKIDEWICLFFLSWIKPCYISVTELRMKSLSSSVVLKTKRIIKKKNPNQTNKANWGRLTTGPHHKTERRCSRIMSCFRSHAAVLFTAELGQVLCLCLPLAQALNLLGQKHGFESCLLVLPLWPVEMTTASVYRNGCCNTQHCAWMQRLSGNQWGIFVLVSKVGRGCDMS